MKKILGLVALSGVLAFSAVPLASTEPLQEQCERKDPNDPNSEEICIPLPGVPSPTSQPAPGGSTQTPEQPPHEAWESPNAGGDDSGSSKPDKPVKPEKPAKPEKEPKPSSSKKPSAASSSDAEGSSTGSGKRPDTVCAGEFCGGDTLIGGTGNANERWPNRHPTQNSNDAPVVTSVRPVDENTPADRVGTIVQTERGVAVETPEGLRAVDPAQAEQFKPGDTVQIQRPGSLEVTNDDSEESESGNDEGGSKHYSDEAVPMLLTGILGGMTGVLLAESESKRRRRTLNYKAYGSGGPDTRVDVATDQDLSQSGEPSSQQGAKHTNPPNVMPRDPNIYHPETNLENVPHPDRTDTSDIRKPTAVELQGVRQGLYAVTGDTGGRLADRYLSGTGEPFYFDRDFVTRAALTGGGGEEYNRHIDAFINSPELAASIAQADSTGEAQTGTFSTPWVTVFNAEDEFHYTLGNYSITFVTNYTVHPNEDGTGNGVEYTTRAYIYDWHDYDPDPNNDSKAQQLIDMMAKAEETNGAVPFDAYGVSDPINGEVVVVYG